MKKEELAATLREMYHNAPHGEVVTMIHLFAVKYAKEIRGSGVSPKDLAVAAGISHSYGTEINKGLNLAKYVCVMQRNS